MKKLTTKLLMSIIAVAFAFVALGTSTYAWFAMNNSVTVSGLNITAKSNSIYLLVSNGENDTAAEIQAITPAATSVNFNMSGDATKVYPAAHDAFNNAAAVGSVANWYYKTADAPTASASSGAATALTSFTNYVIKQTVYITLAKDSINATNLKVSATFAQGAAGEGNGTHTYDPVKVVVVATPATGTAAFEELAAEDRDESNVVTGTTVLAATVTDDAVITVDIYLYYDGNDTDVYTTNFANLDGSAVSLAFSVDNQ